MRILAINASYRGDRGYTRVLLDKLVSGATAAGAECEIVTLAHFKLNHCLACDKCQTEEHYLSCVLKEKDDVQQIFQKMSDADLFVFAAPVYVFGISVLLKTLLDRTHGMSDCSKLILTKSGLLFHHTNRSVSGKPFAAVICYDNVENATPANSISYFKTYARFQDVRLAGILVRNAGRLAGHGKMPSREQFFPKLTEVYKAYEQAGYELAKQKYISRSTQRKANQEIVPVKLFSILKQIGPLKKRFLKRANSMKATFPIGVI
jgi:multimeric flavodoxin WrbA